MRDLKRKKSFVKMASFRELSVIQIPLENQSKDA